MKKLSKIDQKLFDKLLKLVMEKSFPERTVEMRGFDNGKQVVLQRIVYKAGGFKIKSRWINPKYGK